MNTENAKLWIAALRSEEYAQTKGTLQNANGYCCLGVACRVAEKEGVPINTDLQGRLRGSSLDAHQPAVYAWLDITPYTMAEAMGKNDHPLSVSFARIAGWLDGMLS